MSADVLAADDGPDPDAARAEEDAALQDALAAAHAAIWGHGVLGGALPEADRPVVVAGEEAHRDVRDRVAGLLRSRGLQPAAPRAGYRLPFPVLSPVDAAALGVVLEDGVAAAWVTVLGRAVERATRELAVTVLGATELRAVDWRTRAGRSPVTEAFPGL
ncbi:DUF4439 domain-containing protein [Modestobacter sp. I12A-02628]|uniref:DUF4439 domain-containing protein n=1 Tax=Goekera deserti TaxID=2497753 RepID=A0A7K3WJD5_9ACTN|nr:ferritin-like domain-containing protein [Goekera deserti]MPQ97238.1 DUF4439 domain-containing protein [Goekera deserti]NDI50252.1 DUF4439 domain-containing protein [Goekera deserti]NEL55820.1 DUF4439 domain-containing protein [Goekera deserti]